jgi:uncharacterized protein YcnI
MKNVLKKWSVGLMSTCAALLIFAGTVSAHVTVNPGVSAPGAWETYTIKVPVEKNVATKKVALKVPTGVEVMSYQPVPEWKVTIDKDDSGKTKTITWETTGTGIAAGQFQQFYFVAKNPEKETQAAWDAFQYYKDGTVVEWTGDEGSDSPHSITQITAANGNTNAGHDEHHHDTNDKAEKTVNDETKSEKNGSQTIVLTLSIIALILSIIALVISLMKRK